MKITAIGLVVVGATAFTTTPSGAQAPVRSITVERGPCLGTCPVYRFKVDADGKGLFVRLFARLAPKKSPLAIPVASGWRRIIRPCP
ncbi:DUF6438 domain-containing protein [Rhizobium sullae]|uniref:DUF6438 domain-containing protein n=1 Tax=Rhizobium sullae TaxID=50338 RepID=UPI001FCDF056|nr:DUF6438 domain-containing protein [Rhizobium sullae]